MLGRYGRITDKRDDGSFFVEFSAEADCMVLPGHRYRIVDLRVGDSASITPCGAVLAMLPATNRSIR
jgi:hypothetical protein